MGKIQLLLPCESYLFGPASGIEPGIFPLRLVSSIVEKMIEHRRKATAPAPTGVFTLLPDGRVRSGDLESPVGPKNPAGYVGAEVMNGNRYGCWVIFVVEHAVEAHEFGVPLAGKFCAFAFEPTMQVGNEPLTPRVHLWTVDIAADGVASDRCATEIMEGPFQIVGIPTGGGGFRVQPGAPRPLEN